MDLNRKFEHQVGGKVVTFDVRYDPSTHHFNVLEDANSISYRLIFTMQTRKWHIEDGPAASLSAEELALLVQKSYGMFV